MEMILLKRLIKKNGIEVQSPVINISPLYNPLGKGEPTEFSDEKSYQRMMNQHTMELIDERNKKKEKEEK